MSAPIRNVRYAYDVTNHQWVAPNRAPLSGTPDIEAPNFNDASPPWQLKQGETLLDNMPDGVTIVNSQNFSSSTDFYTLMSTIDSTATGPVYVQLEAKTYTISDFHQYGTNDWRGFANVNKKVMGWIGHGAESTIIQVQPTAVSSTPGAANYVLNATSGTTGPVAIVAGYMSNSGSSTPLFISGITFRGTLQTPYSVYSTASQAHFRKNQTVASPLAWRGLTFWGSIQGARLQYCRFQGFAFALNTAPPYENGSADSNRDNGLVVYRTEIDGRIAPEIDSGRPVSAGGWMLNKSVDATIQDSWEHHTRRSGFATNTNTGSPAERYKAINFKAERIADTNDTWAGDNGYFNGSNVEGVVGIFTYTNVYFNVTSGVHINWAIGYSDSNGPYPTSTQTTIVVRGFHTDDTLYGGCLRIAVLKNPNSTGISPVWTDLNAKGIVGSGFFDIQDSDGNTLIGVKSTSWNSSMTKDQYFVVIY